VDGKKYIVRGKRPNEIEEIKFKFKDAVQGYYSGVAVDKSGHLLTWGYDGGSSEGRGLWGVGSKQIYEYDNGRIEGKSSKAFILVNADSIFEKVDGRHQTRIALSKDGEVYSWGRKLNNSLGDTEGDNFRKPEKIKGLSNIKEISMGYRTGLALDKDGDVYSWGRGFEGQLGTGKTNSRQKPEKINGLENIKHIHSGKNSMFAVNEDGELYAWGDNTYGQLGFGDRSNKSAPFKIEVEGAGEIKQVAAGEYHTIVLDKNGDVFVAGSDSHGQLGLGDENETTVDLTPVPFPDNIQVDEVSKEIKVGEGIKIKGNISSLSSGNDLQLKYAIRFSEDNEYGEAKEIKEIESSTTGSEFEARILDEDNNLKAGNYSIKFISENKDTGMISESESQEFTVLNPESPIIEIQEYEGDWLNEKRKMNGTIRYEGDARIGKIKYKLNGGDWQIEDGEKETDFTINKDDLNNGENILEAKVIDTAENKSKTTTKIIKVDTKAPDISINEVEDIYNPNGEGETIKVEVSDKTSGLKEVSCEINFVGGEIKKECSDIFKEDFQEGQKEIIGKVKVPEEPGEYEIKIEAIDVAGNKSEKSKEFIREGIIKMEASPKTIAFKEGEKKLVVLNGTGEQKVESSFKIVVTDTRVEDPGWEMNIKSERFEGIERDIKIEEDKYTSEKAKTTLEPDLSLTLPKSTKVGEYKATITIILNKGSPDP